MGNCQQKSTKLPHMILHVKIVIKHIKKRTVLWRHKKKCIQENNEKLQVIIYKNILINNRRLKCKNM